MADDIVTRLRDQAQAPALAWLADAADEIERLRAEVDLKGSRLDDALDKIKRLRADIDTLFVAVQYGCPPSTWNQHRQAAFLQEIREIEVRARRGE